jgi:hypothetical protein
MGENGPKKLGVASSLPVGIKTMQRSTWADDMEPLASQTIATLFE